MRECLYQLYRGNYEKVWQSFLVCSLCMLKASSVCSSRTFLAFIMLLRTHKSQHNNFSLIYCMQIALFALFFVSKKLFLVALQLILQLELQAIFPCLLSSENVRNKQHLFHDVCLLLRFCGAKYPSKKIICPATSLILLQAGQLEFSVPQFVSKSSFVYKSHANGFQCILFLQLSHV